MRIDPIEIRAFVEAEVLLGSALMKMAAKIFMYLTLWSDLCLILGVIFTGNYHGVKMSALISTGNFSVDSHTPGGATFIMVISIWTGALAICGLLALRKSQIHNLASTP